MRLLPFAALAALRLAVTAPAADPGEIELTLLDDQVIHGATFQSHNQKVVTNGRGIFAAYVKTRNKEYTAQEWRLVGSTDGGKTFRVTDSGTAATNPPVLETDIDDNLYLGRADWVKGDAYLVRYLASEEYKTPHVTELPGGAAGKFAMAYDAKRKGVVFFSHNNEFYRVGQDGKLVSRVTLLKAGTNAVLQYPSLAFDERGDLYAGWTTSRPDKYLYHDIHLMRSRDGGETWETLTGETLSTPVVADDTGPTQRMTLDDEFEVHTWLCNLLPRHGKLHAMYQAQAKPVRFNYLRYDLTTGREDLRLAPQFAGKSLALNGLDGAFSSRTADPKAPLVAVVKDARKPRLAALRSDDNGATWGDLAASKEVTAPYAVSGCRELTADGSAVGIFTDSVEPSDEPKGKSKVYFYRIKLAGTKR